MKSDAAGRTLTTTECSLRVIETIVREDGVMAADLAAELDLAQSTIHKHLNTLSQFGYVVRENNRYHVGAKFCHIGDYVRRRKPEYLIAGDLVAELAQETELEADFAIEENGHVISLYNELHFSDNTHFLADGRFFHVHSTASGKAMLAEYSDERVRNIIRQMGMPKKTERTMTSEDELFEELEEIRERGYATSNEEMLEGLWSIAKVVKTPIGDVCGSLNLSAPTYLYSEDVHQSAAETLERHVEIFEDRIETQFEEMYGQA